MRRRAEFAALVVVRPVAGDDGDDDDFDDVRGNDEELRLVVRVVGGIEFTTAE